MICYTYENLTGRQVLIRLNSGQTLFIEPGGCSGEIPGDEVDDNAMVDKLLNRHIIAAHPATLVEPLPASPPSEPGPEPSPDTWREEPEFVTKPKKQSKPKSKGGK